MKNILKEIKAAFRRPYGYFCWPISVLLFLLIAFATLREPIFKHFLSNKITQFNEKYNAEFSYQDITFHGLSSVSLHQISIQEKSAQPLLVADKIDIEIDFWKLLWRRLSIESINIDNCTISMFRNQTRDNFSFLFKGKKEDSEVDAPKKTVAQTVEHIFDMLFDLVPKKLVVNNFNLSYANDIHNISIAIPQLELLDKSFKCKVSVTEFEHKKTIVAEGILDKSNEQASIKLYSNDSLNVDIPWLKYRNNAMVKFDTAYFKLKHKVRDDLKQEVSGTMSAKNMQLYHRRIASDTVLLAEISNDFILNFGDNDIEFDSNSTVILNQLAIHPYLYYNRGPSEQLIMSLNKPLFEASILFNSLPNGLFDNFTGIKVSGQLSYHGYFKMDFATPDSLIFESDLKQQNFKIIKPGSTDFRKINETFEHHIFENDKEVKTIVLGTENPNFLPFEQIPVSLKNAILMSEDGWFFEHGGFSLGAFRESIIANVKTKRFARGGSTISMQLVKNLYLNRNKNIARKVEELLIVWMLERQKITTKERMFEIYVNIIEWGPGIYGASEAARFYFNKEVSALTLEECIYLAAIIPSPKGFLFLFNDDRSFKEYILNYYKLVLLRMVEHEKISQQEADAAIIHVSIVGAAKNLLDNKHDSLVKRHLIKH